MSTTVAPIRMSISAEDESNSPWALWNAGLLLDRSMFDIVNWSSATRTSRMGQSKTGSPQFA
jgi:hypothetical protein